MSDNNDYITKKRILNTARKIFFTIGYSKTTMDELSTELRMSKKTLYQFFNSKQILLEAVIYDFFQEFQNKINQLLEKNNHNGLGIFKQFLFLVQSQISQFNIHAFDDIRKNNPDAWQKINQLRKSMINGKLRELLKQGKKDETIRKDVDLDIIVLIILNTIQSIAIPEVISQYSYSTKEILEIISTIIMDGISTSKIY